ncbi:MAG: peptidoglycan DD-metalloendopeptidase family protein [Candidatus Alcyoniella australis]|nr:peptidoglycan DD-metalloendopeptidase family protein [Candidatus Alcyoniella australis]
MLRTIAALTLAVLLTAVPAVAADPVPATLAQAQQVPQMQPQSFVSDRGYLWPLLTPIRISGNFGEYRIGHPHAGLDLSTYGVIGTPVVAVADGWVCRARTSAVGYGKALYIRLEDGNTVVYAHLDGMIDEIWTRMRAYHRQIGSYEADLFLKPGEIKVTAGQVIGYAGNTGTSSPHLHFELRGPDNCPLNPLTHGFFRDDSIPPQPLEIFIDPLSHDATVNGGRSKPVLPLVKRDGHYSSGRPISISGEVGFGLRVIDRIDGSDRILAPYQLRAELDGKTIFLSQFQRSCYEHKQVINYAYDLELYFRHGHGYHRLFRKWVEQTAFDLDGDGVIRDLPQGEHTLRLIATDVSDNSTVVELTLIANRAPELFRIETEQTRVLLGGSDPDGEPNLLLESAWSADHGRSWHAATTHALDAGRWELEPPMGRALEGLLIKARTQDGHGLHSPWRLFYARPTIEQAAALPQISISYRLRELYTEIVINTAEPLLREPTVKVSGGGEDEVLLPGVWQGNGRYMAILDNNNIVSTPLSISASGRDRQGREVRANIAAPLQLARGGARLKSNDGRFAVRLGRGTLERPFYTTLEQTTVPEPKQGLQQVGAAYCIERKGVPLGGKIGVSIKLPEGQTPNGVGVYYYDSGRWWQMGFNHDPASRTISGRAPQLGTFALMRDVQRPYIKWTGPRANAKLRNARPALSFVVSDAGSGIPAGNTVLTLDGQRVVGESNGPRGWIKYIPDQNLEPGEHTIKLQVTDRAGNSRSLEQNFKILQ